MKALNAIILVISFSFLVIPKAFGQDFSKFHDQFQSSDIEFLDSVAEAERAHYQQTKKIYHHFNEKLVYFKIATVKGEDIEAIKYLIEILEHCTDCNTNQIGWVKYNLASVLSAINAPQQSQKYLLPIINGQNEQFEEKLNYLIIDLVASNYFHMQEYDSALEYYNRSLEYYKKTNNTLMIASMENNIGLCLLHISKFNNAIYHFKKGAKTIEKAKSQNKGIQDFKIIIEGNLGSTYDSLKNYSKAIHYLNQEFEHFIGDKQNHRLIENTISELLLLYLQIGDYASAEKLIQKTESYVGSILEFNNSKTAEPILLEALKFYYSKTNNLSKELQVSNEINKRQKSYVNYILNRTEILNEMMVNTQLSQFKSEVENQKIEFEKSENQRKSMNWILTLTLIIVLIVLIVSIYFARLKRREIEKDSIILKQNANILENKSQLLEREIGFQNERLDHMSQILTIKKETEQAFLGKINELKRNQTTNPEQAIRELQITVSSLLNLDEKMKSSKITNDENIQRFKENLKVAHPDLTKSDIEFCLLLRMNLASKDIAAIRNKSYGTVRVYKNRLKNKLNLSEKTSISDYLKSLDKN